jgi:ADP-ribosylglycohydrolase
MLVAASSDLEVASRRQADAELQSLFAEGVRDIAADLELATSDDPQLDGAAEGHALDILMQAGFVRVAFRLAFWQLLHAPSFESALIDVVNRGGDADTNGAITGALLGAYYGEHKIPTEWRDAVLCARGLGPQYHPNVLLNMLETKADETISR